MAKFDQCLIDPKRYPKWQARNASRENQPLITQQSVGSELLCSGMWWLHPGHCSAPDIHDADELYYVIGGQGKIVLDDEEHVVRQGMSVYIPCNVTHQTFNDDDEDLIYYWVFAPPPTGSAKQDLENWVEMEPEETS